MQGSKPIATDHLERLGELAGPALRAALAAEPPLEAHRRVSALLANGVGGYWT